MAFVKKFFAAANTSSGFHSYFGDIFSPDKLNRIYIIKGGPGTGKSTMMKLIAANAEKRGYEVEYYYCSSDPYSLDGIIITELSAAVIDGTAPHMTDPKYPGAVETILNFGEFFDLQKLSDSKEEIKRLIRENSQFHKRSALYYSYAGSAARETLRLISSVMDKEKMKKAAARLISCIPSDGGGGDGALGQIGAFSSRGDIRLDTYSSAAQTTVSVCGRYLSDLLFLDTLRTCLSEKKIFHYYSPSTLLPDMCDTIYVPAAKTLFERSSEKGEKTVNMRRFIESDGFSLVRGRIRFSEKLRQDLTSEAEKCILHAGTVHDQIEEIYKNAVDFNGVRGLIRSVMNELFGDKSIKI